MQTRSAKVQPLPSDRMLPSLFPLTPNSIPLQSPWTDAVLYGLWLHMPGGGPLGSFLAALRKTTGDSEEDLFLEKPEFLG